MSNLSVRPLLTTHWLLSSLCWAVVCLGGWLGGNYLLAYWPGKEELTIYYFPLGGFIANGLLAHFALRKGWAVISRREAARPLWLTVVAGSWFSILALFQVLCLASFLFILSWFFW